MAYFLVHSRAVASYLGRSDLYTCAISGTRGSSGLGSVSIEQMDKSTAVDIRAEKEHLWRLLAQGSIDPSIYPDKYFLDLDGLVKQTQERDNERD